MSALQTQTAPEDSALIFRNIGKSKTTVILQVHTYTHTRAFLETHSHMPCIHTHTHTLSHTYTCMNTHPLTHTPSHTYTCVHRPSHTHMHTHPLTYMCAHILFHTQTRVHTHPVESCMLPVDFGPSSWLPGSSRELLTFPGSTKTQRPPARELRTRASGPDEWPGH